MVGQELVDLGEATTRAESFRRLADQHLDKSYRLARAILGNEADAEDATQDAFVVAWRKWSTLRDPDLFERWFDRILVNTCRNRMRRTRRWAIQDLSADLSIAALDEIAQAPDRELVEAALMQLSLEHRIVVVLRFYRDLTTEEIGRRLGIRQGTVKSRLHYGLRRLHRVLEETEAKGQRDD
jgi:RNA polymerase sigma-70 factor (ECF subfamily)